MGTASGNPQASLLERSWAHLSENAYLTVNDDTLYFEDGSYVFHPSTKNGLCIQDDTDPNAGLTGTGAMVCWSNSDINFSNNDIVRVGITSKPFWARPEKIHNSIKTSPNYVGERIEAGAVWLSWRIPFPGPDTVEQLQAEKDDFAHYEYQTLRDGDGKWRTIWIEESEIGLVELIPTPFGTLIYQRRKFLVKGLDPNGEYSFCIRAVNPGGAGAETCNLDAFYPVSTEPAETPQTTVLHQNYPNPFNPSTAINYEITDIQHVRIEAFNTLGQSVGVLVDGVRPPGTHTVRFDASGLPSGLYVYLLSVGSQTLTRTMLLSR